MKDKYDNLITDLSVADSCLCSKLRAASRMVSRTYDHALKPVGLKSNQMTILIAISLMEPISITHLSEKISTERTTLTRNLRPLEKSGFVKVKDGYGRTRELTLTQKGKTLLELAKPLWNIAQSNLVSQLGQDDTGMITRLLKEISNFEVVT